MDTPRTVHWQYEKLRVTLHGGQDMVSERCRHIDDLDTDLSRFESVVERKRAKWRHWVAVWVGNCHRYKRNNME